MHQALEQLAVGGLCRQLQGRQMSRVADRGHERKIADCSVQLTSEFLGSQVAAADAIRGFEVCLARAVISDDQFASGMQGYAPAAGHDSHISRAAAGPDVKRSCPALNTDQSAFLHIYNSQSCIEGAGLPRFHEYATDRQCQ